MLVKEKEFEEKNVSYYSVLLHAWIDSNMEYDKTLISLSSLGIALLVTILSTIKPSSWWILASCVISFFGFGACIWICLTIYLKNTDHIENLLHDNQDPRLSLKLVQYDKRSKMSFVLGVIGFCLAGIISALK
jgi:hypothetical protein